MYVYVYIYICVIIYIYIYVCMCVYIYIQLNSKLAVSSGYSWFSCANEVLPSNLSPFSASLLPRCRIWSFPTRRFCISWKRTRACWHRPAWQIQHQSLRFNSGTKWIEWNLQKTMRSISFWTKTSHTHTHIYIYICVCVLNNNNQK